MAFFRGETDGPIHVMKANFFLLLISSPVSKRTYAYALWSSAKNNKKKNYYFNDPIVKIFMCSIAALNTIIRHIRSPHTCTLVSYLLKGQVAPRIPCRTLRARSSCPDRHLHKESRPCIVIKHQNDNANTHTHTHKGKNYSTIVRTRETKPFR